MESKLKFGNLPKMRKDKQRFLPLDLPNSDINFISPSTLGAISNWYSSPTHSPTADTWEIAVFPPAMIPIFACLFGAQPRYIPETHLA